MSDGPIRIYAALPATLTKRNEVGESFEEKTEVTVSNTEVYNDVRIELPKNVLSVTFCRSDLQKILTSFYEVEGGVR
jgi:hypothetical protein